jgi:D-threo-aldose 1-dehydrogenase
MTDFEKRCLGRTTVEVTTLGLGCATLGGSRVPVRHEEGEAIVRTAWAAGVRYVDTAPLCGFGQAERCVGEALREVPRDEWMLSTKVGRLLRPHNLPASEHRQHQMPFDAVFDYSYDAIMRSFEDSLLRLGLARIDILYVHDIGAMQHGPEAHPPIMSALRESGYRALEELRRCGTVRAIGIGVDEREALLEAMEWGAWDAFLLAGRYTLLEQAPLDDLLPKCLSSGISIVVGGALNSGILAGRDTWNYKAAPPDIVVRVGQIKTVCDSHQVPLAAAALQFPLAHPAVAAIIPGPRCADEFTTNLERSCGYPIPAGLWTDLRDVKLLHPLAPTPAMRS